MADTQPKPKKKDSQKAKLISLGKSIFVEAIPGFAKPVYHFIIAEAKGIRRGWVLCLVVAVLFGFGGYKTSEYRAERQFVAATTSFSISNSYSLGVISGLKTRLLQDPQPRRQAHEK